MEIKKLTEVTKQVHLKDARCPGREANIIFLNGKFLKVMFGTENRPYSREDWEFLELINKEIKQVEVNYRRYGR